MQLLSDAIMSIDTVVQTNAPISNVGHIEYHPNGLTEGVVPKPNKDPIKQPHSTVPSESVHTKQTDCL